jgi:peptidoglycan/xylan/chitin deacetylase (PgdA/CDA1 family)
MQSDRLGWAGLQHGVHWLAYVSGASAVRAWRQDVRRIITFHSVGGAAYPAHVFEAQVRYLQKHFAIVPLEAMLQQNPERQRAPRHQVALTFDDGLQSHYKVVHPILQRLRAPATFFVCPGLIDSRRWLWNHEALGRLESLTRARRAALCRELQVPCDDADRVVTWMKSLALVARSPIEAAIRAATPAFCPSAWQRETHDLMTWDELRSIDPALVTVGSHTVNHPILTTLDAADLSYEIRESRRWLEHCLQRPVEHFCYPDGAYNDAVVRCVQECYRSAVTSVKGTVAVGDDAHRLKRIPTARQIPALAWRMHRLPRSRAH